jgi:type II secretory pathway pseudopilin PulG
MRRSIRKRRAVILLEALIALALIGTAAVSLLALTASDTEAVRRLTARSDEINAASRFLDAVALWTREDLDRRLGTRPQGPYRLRILRPTPLVYTVELLDAATERPLLATAVYRPEVRVEILR